MSLSLTVSQSAVQCSTDLPRRVFVGKVARRKKRQVRLHRARWWVWQQKGAHAVVGVATEELANPRGRCRRPSESKLELGVF